MKFSIKGGEGYWRWEIIIDSTGEYEEKIKK